MKRIIITSLTLIALLSACSTYQMNTLSSTNSVHDEKTGDFKFENDSVKIVYSFSGENAPIHIDIFNKLNEPVYVDWERSAIINGKQSYSYADEAIQINGDISSISVGKNITFSNGSIDAKASVPKNVAFLPPHSQTTKTISKINKQSFQYIPGDTFVNTKLASSFDSSGKNVKLAKFNSENSPLLFKSYLTLYTLNGSTPKFTAYTNDFYVSEIIRSSSSPDNFSFYHGSRGDFFTSSVGGN